jgi:DNA-binding response OmpR family regulator
MLRPAGILIVDDDGGVRRVVGAGLRFHGLAVWPAASGREATGIYREHRGAIGLVLLDVQMPGRDGPETLADLRALDPDVRVCFMTGNAGRYTDQDLVDLGALAVFAKPLNLRVLAARLGGLLSPDERTASRTAPVVRASAEGRRDGRRASEG